MARVNITEILPGESNDASNVNASFSQWSAESTGIDEENVREEGVDERPLASSLITGDVESDSLTTTVTHTARNAWVQVVDSGGSDVTTGSMSFESGDAIVARFTTVVYLPKPGSVGSGHHSTVRMALAYKDNAAAGSWTRIDVTERRLRLTDSKGKDSNSVQYPFRYGAAPARGTLGAAHFLTEVSSSTDIEFGMQVYVNVGSDPLSQDSAGITNAMVSAIVYRK